MRTRVTRLAEIIREHLKISVQSTAFEIQIERLTEPRSTGYETVEFLFAPNVGEPLKPLKVIASSGEICVMLAVKTALAEQDLVGLLVFDRIDANVGGEIAHSIGTKCVPCGNRQVLAITHMPHSRCGGSRHFYVSKAVNDGRPDVADQVVGTDRVEELARMLGGRQNPRWHTQKSYCEGRSDGSHGDTFS